MNVRFLYDKEKDIWCLLNKGKSSNNSPLPTGTYKKLISEAGESPSGAVAALFIEKYVRENEIDVERRIREWGELFDNISAEFQGIAEKVFGASLNRELKAYLTINTRCPYSIEEGWFFVSASKPNPLLTVMHELWHFYTWERFGEAEQREIGFEKYNEMKEALTVLLNVECGHLLPADAKDIGYPQHQELRVKIIEWWKENPDIQYVWDKAKA